MPCRSGDLVAPLEIFQDSSGESALCGELKSGSEVLQVGGEELQGLVPQRAPQHVQLLLPAKNPLPAEATGQKQVMPVFAVEPNDRTVDGALALVRNHAQKRGAVSAFTDPPPRKGQHAKVRGVAVVECVLGQVASRVTCATFRHRKPLCDKEKEKSKCIVK